ncbi:DUF4124 domain-containing protein [Pseudoalteromonas sp. T1lg65]|uniref:DUF4124 domain-containing protein n=1 Tax=Pseudoalteromonas sp. T1lg65 TaxID=2077101 RepID=UPI003F7AA3A3
MRFVSYLLIMVMLVGLASLFIVKRPDGKPWLSAEKVAQAVEQQFDNLTQQSKEMRSLVSDNVIPAPSDKVFSNNEQVMYRWRDEAGQWHYSDKPNPNGASEAYLLDESRINTMAIQQSTMITPAKSTKQPVFQGISGLTTADPQKVMVEAKKVQKLMEERQRQLDKAIEQHQ